MSGIRCPWITGRIQKMKREGCVGERLLFVLVDTRVEAMQTCGAAAHVL